MSEIDELRYGIGSFKIVDKTLVGERAEKHLVLERFAEVCEYCTYKYLDLSVGGESARNHTGSESISFHSNASFVIHWIHYTT